MATFILPLHRNHSAHPIDKSLREKLAKRNNTDRHYKLHRVQVLNRHQFDVLLNACSKPTFMETIITAVHYLWLPKQKPLPY